MANYFNTLSLGQKLDQLSKCRFMDTSEFDTGVDALKNKKIVIIGCGAQGLNQGLNMRDSGLDISYALRDQAIAQQRQSFKNASENGFTVGNYQELIPTADLVLNLTPDKQHSNVIDAVMPLMKKGATILKGTHNFTTFRASNCQAKSPIKTLKKPLISKSKNKIIFTFQSKSFLQQQVRSMVGSLKYLGEGKWNLKDFKRAFESKKRSMCAPPAPAHGLYLVKVKY